MCASAVGGSARRLPYKDIKNLQAIGQAHKWPLAVRLLTCPPLALQFFGQHNRHDHKAASTSLPTEAINCKHQAVAPLSAPDPLHGLSSAHGDGLTLLSTYLTSLKHTHSAYPNLWALPDAPACARQGVAAAAVRHRHAPRAPAPGGVQRQLPQRLSHGPCSALAPACSPGLGCSPGF